MVSFLPSAKPDIDIVNEEMEMKHRSKGKETTKSGSFQTLSLPLE